MIKALVILAVALGAAGGLFGSLVTGHWWWALACTAILVGVAIVNSRALYDQRRR